MRLNEDTPVDLLILLDSCVLKCQCKLIYERPNGSHAMNLYSVRKWGPNAKAVKHLYTAAEVDFFIGYCVADDAVYVVPFADCKGHGDVLRFWINRLPRGVNQHVRYDSSRWRNAFHLLSL